jgi:aminodeoxyfutalosine synthase
VATPDADLEDIAGRVAAGERLTGEDGVRLLKTKDLFTLGRLARLACRRRHGDRVYFVVNRHINHTNVCVNGCRFCAFGKKPGDPQAFTLSLDEIEARAGACREMRLTELHIVGGLNPALGLDFYVDMLRRLRRALPEVHIKALTAVEIDYLARREGLTVTEVLRILKEAGSRFPPGGRGGGLRAACAPPRLPAQDQRRAVA